MPKRRFFIDTDTGTDDAVALIMALRHPEVEVVGISAVSGNVILDKVVQNIGYVCELCDRSIPFFKGSDRPLERESTPADFIHGTDGLGDIGLDLTGRNAAPGNAIDQIISFISDHPNELELICLGPLTNIARAILKVPNLLTSVKKLFIMGGLVRLPGNVTPVAEYNIWADPEAADTVLHSIHNLHVPCTMIGWDSTLDCSNLNLDELEDLAKISTPLAKFATAIQAPRIKWLKDQNMDITVNIADALAMAVALDDSLVTSRKRYHMSVETGKEDEKLRGFVRVKEVKTMPYIDYVHLVDRERYIALIRKSVDNQPITSLLARSY